MSLNDTLTSQGSDCCMLMSDVSYSFAPASLSRAFGDESSSASRHWFKLSSSAGCPICLLHIFQPLCVYADSSLHLSGYLLPLFRVPSNI